MTSPAPSACLALPQATCRWRPAPSDGVREGGVGHRASQQEWERGLGDWGCDGGGEDEREVGEAEGTRRGKRSEGGGDELNKQADVANHQPSQ